MAAGMTRRRAVAATVAALGLAALAACSEPASPGSRSDDDNPWGQPSRSITLPATPSPSVPPRPLRAGERRITLTMSQDYHPAAPHGSGTDDYRCFLLDPKLRRPAYLTGTNVLPGNPSVVHHAILFRVPPDLLAGARRLDAAEPGDGWTCFGNTDFGGPLRLDDAPWLGAWAPGAKEAVSPKGFGTRLEPGTRIVLQVHYNLLAGKVPDRSAVQLRLAPASARLTELHTMLMPAPVEMPCRPGHRQSPLCDRDASVRDVMARFGSSAGQTANALHLLCGTPIRPGSVQSCTRVISQPVTVRAVAGHMHLLGRSMSIRVERAQGGRVTLLRIPVWNFDDQAARPVTPLRLEPFDKVTVTCRHVQWLRDRLPAFEGKPDRYVVWGDGTTDEMCLGILTVSSE